MDGKNADKRKGMIALLLPFFLALIFWSANHYTEPITILNPQSYPKVGGQWTVDFETAGAGELKIENLNPDAVFFSGLFYEENGDWIETGYTISGNKLIIEWPVLGKSDESRINGRLIMNVGKAGKHQLRFSFIS